MKLTMKLDDENLARNNYARRKTHQVKVGDVGIGSQHPIVVQSMTNTATDDVEKTVQQCIDLHEAGSEIVRFTVMNESYAKAVPSIKKRMADKGYGHVPLVGDFHYNGHLLLGKFPQMAAALDKYRINPGNAGFGQSRDKNFETMIKVAIDNGKPVRIGINWGSLDQDLLAKMMDANQKLKEPLPVKTVGLNALVESAVSSEKEALDIGLGKDQIILSAKTSGVQELVYTYRTLAERTQAPLHQGVTEAGMGSKGIVTASVGTSLLLQEGIGDTIRVSTTPQPGETRTNEVLFAQQILQATGVRNFIPVVTSCPGCGRTTSTVFQEMALEITNHLRAKMPQWKKAGYDGVEDMHVAVMGCIVNGPGESKGANIGISLPGTGEDPLCPIFADGKQITQMPASRAKTEFKAMIDEYVKERYGKAAKAVSKTPQKK